MLIYQFTAAFKRSLRFGQRRPREPVTDGHRRALALEPAALGVRPNEERHENGRRRRERGLRNEEVQ